MRRVMTLGLMALALFLAVGVSAEGAASDKAPAFKKSPIFTVDGFSLNASGLISGLNPSNESPNDTMVFLIAYGELTVDCFDSSANLVGEATAPIYGIRGEQYIQDSQLRSHTSFNVTTPAAAMTPDQAGCPTGSTYTVPRDVTFWSAHVGVDKGGYIVLGRFYYL
jgi:hypothetical protein